MATAAKKAEKNQESVRKLSLKPENRDCMDCIVKGTPNVVMDFGIFVCSFCSGIHRSHQFKAKGISMTNFKDSEVEYLSTMGNDKARRIWRANWDPNKFPLPKAYDERAIKDFIRRTYVEKQWYNPSGAEASKPPVHEEEETPKVQPISNIIKDPAPLEVKRKTSGAQATPAPAPKAAPKAAEAPLFGGFEETVSTNNGGWDTNPTFEASFEEDGFSTAPTIKHTTQAAPQPQPQAVPAKKAINIDDLFGPTSAPQAAPAPTYTQPQATQGNPFDTSGFFGGAPQTQQYYPPQQQFQQYPPQQQYQQYPPQYPQHPQQHGGAYQQQYPQQYPPQYGAPAGGNPFGAPAPNAFGGAPNPFGAPTSTPFGAPQTAPAPNAFGASAFTAPSPVMGTRPAPTPAQAPAPAPAPVHDPFATLDVFSAVKTAPAPAPVRSAPSPALAASAPKPTTQSVDDLFSF